MAKIKICGLKRAEDIQAVNQFLPDYCGFIIEFEKSRRNVSRDRVRELVSSLDPAVTPVGVFVNADPELPAALANEGTIQIIQLHGQEDERYLTRLRSLTKASVIQAFSIKTKEDILRALQSTADYILLDQGAGGTGQTFDWSLVPEVSRPFFLAGGLGADNLEQAIRSVKPFAVDLSSSVETQGYKDPQKIKEATELVRCLS